MVILKQVYVRPAGSYVMDRLELRQVSSYPETASNVPDLVILIGNFNVPTGLRAAEAALSNQEVLSCAELLILTFLDCNESLVLCTFLYLEMPMRKPLFTVVPVDMHLV